MRLFAVFQLLLLSTFASAGTEQQSPASIVARLYEDYAWEAVEGNEHNGLGLMQASSSTLGKYFDPALTTLIVRDRECAEHTHQICRLDFLPIWDSQDPAAIGLTLNATKDPSVVQVRFTYPGNQKQVELTYSLKNSPAGWRITNITGANWNLLNILSGQP